MPQGRKCIIGGVLFSGLFLIGSILYIQYIAAQAVEKGLQYCMSTQYDKAIVEFNKSIQLNPYSARAYNGRGLAYSFKNNFDRAIADYNKCIELNPHQAQVNINRAVAYYFKRKYDKAWQDVYLAQALGSKVDRKFIEDLEKASIRKDK